MADAQQEQVKATELQKFESTFFEMLDTHRSIVNALVYRSSGKTFTGRQAIGYYVASLKNNIGKVDKRTHTRERIADAYDFFWKSHRRSLSHYFRFLFNFLRFLDRSDVSEDFHGKLLRSQFSDEELTLLFYNCLSHSRAKFEAYAAKFELFDNMAGDDFVNIEHAKYVDPKCFGPDKRGILGE